MKNYDPFDSFWRDTTTTVIILVVILEVGLTIGIIKSINSVSPEDVLRERIEKLELQIQLRKCP